MDSWKQSLFSLILCAFCCAMVLQLVTDPAKKKRMRFVCGLVLILSILRPLAGVDVQTLFPVPQWEPGVADSYIAQGKKSASDERSSYIKTACEAYILDKAKALGVDLTVRVLLDDEGIPAFAELEGRSGPEARSALETLLSADLGIPKENQTWIWNQESSTS